MFCATFLGKDGGWEQAFTCRQGGPQGGGAYVHPKGVKGHLHRVIRAREELAGAAQPAFLCIKACSVYPIHGQSWLYV